MLTCSATEMSHLQATFHLAPQQCNPTYMILLLAKMCNKGKNVSTRMMHLNIHRSGSEIEVQ